jgi:hypothetical protein
MWLHGSWAWACTDAVPEREREDGKDFVSLDGAKGVGKNIFGTRFFFDFDVLYDEVDGVIDVRRK